MMGLAACVLNSDNNEKDTTALSEPAHDVYSIFSGFMD